MEQGKKCRGCKIEKSLDEFNYVDKAKGKLRAKCKDCMRLVYGYNPMKVIVKTDEGKVCTKCNEFKKYEEFPRDSRRKDGHRADCKSCVGEFQKNYRKENAEKLAADHKQWCKDNAEYLKERGSQYHKANAEKRNEYTRQYRKANREELNEKKKQYSRTEKGRQVKKQSNSKRRATIHNVISDGSTIADLLKRDGYTCHYCNRDVHDIVKPWQNLSYEERVTKATEDHVVAINNGGTDTIENKVVACQSCNSRKQDKYSYEEFVEMMSKEAV